MLKYQWLLFDADGTLFDYDKAEANAIQKTFLAFDFEFTKHYARAYREINAQIWLAFANGEITQGELRTERFERLSKVVGVDFDPNKFSQKYLQFLGDGHYLLDGAEEVLAELEGQVDLVLITNGLKDVQRARLSQSTIQDYFSDVIISEEVGAAKPDARIFEVAFDKMSNPDKAEVLIIGDSLTSDIRGGNQFGIDTCWYNPKGKICDQDVSIQFEINHLNEILTIIS